MSRLTVTSLPLPELKLVTRAQLGDSRGFFSRLFCAEELHAAGWNEPIAQINHTYTARRGTVRGMHYQREPHAETKLVTCLHGEVWDVAVDLRADSPTYLRWHAERLSVANGNALLIPRGFAHGFQALTDGVELLYCHSEPYVAELEDGIHAEDPKLSIAWPLPVCGLSPRDSGLRFLGESFLGALA